MGLVVAAFALLKIGLPEFFKEPSYFVGLGVLALMAINMIFWIVNMIFLSKHFTDADGKPLIDEK